MQRSPTLLGATMLCAGVLAAQGTQPELLNDSTPQRSSWPLEELFSHGSLGQSFILGEFSNGPGPSYARQASWIALDAKTGERRFLMRRNPAGVAGLWFPGESGSGFAVCIATTGTGPSYLCWSDGTEDSGRVLAQLGGEVIRPAILGKYVAFVGRDPTNGREPWISDGTTAGTGLLADLTVGSGSSDVRELVVWNGRLFFVLHTSAGDKVYTSDGTTPGTRPLFDVTASSATGAGFLFGWKPTAGLLYYAADDGAGKRGLWCIDPVSAQPRFLKQEGGWGPGPAFRLDRIAAEHGGGLMFAGSDSASGTELWFSDGSTTGTRRVADIAAGGGSSDPADLAMVNGGVVFSASTPAPGREPWFSDGTTAGTRMLADVAKGSADGMASPIVGDGTVAFLAADDGSASPQLYAADGNGLRLLTSGKPVVSSFLPLVAAQGRVLVQGRANGDEFWLSDGTAQGTAKIPGFGYGIPSGSIARIVGRTPGFALVAFGVGRWMRLTDGTRAGTATLQGFDSPVNLNQPLVSAGFGPGLYFVGRQQSSNDFLFRTDGTVKGTVGVHPILPTELFRFGDRLLIAGTYPNYGQDHELWISDGTRAGTSMLADLAPGTASSSPSGMVRHLDKVYFSADVPGIGRELFVTDGTTKGTGLVADLVAGAGSGNPRGLFSNAGRLWFVAWDKNLLDWLWVSDGTASGTHTVGPDLYPFTRPVPFRDGAVFAAQDSIAGVEPWYTDGTANGTLRLGDLATGTADSSPETLTVSGDLVFFWAKDTQGNLQVWRSDATTQGTFALTSFRFGGSGPNQCWALRGGV
ncbi:MAG: hypothetical protein R3F30_08040, partial [Planctomycetota bacterium]